MLSVALTAAQVVPVSAETPGGQTDAGIEMQKSPEGDGASGAVSEADRQNAGSAYVSDAGAGLKTESPEDGENGETAAEGETAASETEGGNREAEEAGKPSDAPQPSAAHADGETLVGKMGDKSSGAGKEENTFKTGKLTATGNAKMFAIVTASLEGSEKSRFLRVALSGDGYHFLFKGTAEEASTSGSSSRISGYQNADGKWEFLIPIDEKDGTIEIAALSEKKKAWYPRTITVDQKEMTISSASEEGAKPVPDNKPEETFAPGKLTIVENAAMFKALSAALEEDEGKRYLRIVLSGSGYHVLYKGSAEAAAASKKEDRICGVTNSEGKWEFLIPVSETDGTFDLAALSEKHKSWYKRAVMLDQKKMTISMIAPPTGSYEPVADGLSGEVAEPSGTPAKDPTGTPSQKPSGTPSASPSAAPTKAPTEKPASPTHAPMPSPIRKDGGNTSSPQGNSAQGSTGGSASVGTYSFTWSGGSGRAELSCTDVKVEGGIATATIRFSGTNGRQSHYDSVKVNGKTYSGNNSFTVQLPVDQNVVLEGRTTAMSTPHWITYTVRISTGTTADGKKEGKTVAEQKDRIDEKAPQIDGLFYKDELEVTYTDKVKIFNYDQGISLIEVNLMLGTSRKKAEKDEKKDEQTSESAELYKNPVVKYLIVPEKTEIPAGLDKDVIVVRQPVKNTYVASEELYALLDELGCGEQIGTLGFKDEDVKDAELKKKVEAGGAAYAGAWDSWDFRTLISEKTDLAIEDSRILPGKDAEKEEVEEAEKLLGTLADRAAQMKMALFVDRSADEVNDLARAEWYKVYGTIFGVQDLGKERYEEVLQKAGDDLKNQALEAMKKDSE